MTSDTSEFPSQLQPGSQFIEDFVDKAGNIFWAADPLSFQCVYVSQFAEEVLGYPLVQWRRPFFWQDTLFSEDRERVLATFEAAVAEQTPKELEYRLQAADGSLIWFRDKVCLLTAESRPLLCGMMTDVTTFKTAVGHHIGIPGYTSIYLEIVTMLSANTDIVQRMRQLAERLRTIFALTAVSILEWNTAQGTASPLAYYPEPEEASPQNNYPAVSQLAGLIDELERQETLRPILSSLNDSSLSSWQQTRLQAHHAKTILYVPIPRAENSIGCIELIDNRASRHFTSNDIELCQIVAQQAGIALTKAQLFQTEARRRREAEILLDVAEFISSSLDLEEILARVMEILRVYLTDVHNCAISLISENGFWLETITSWQADEAYELLSKGSQEKISDVFTAQLAIDSGEPIVISDLKKIPFTNEFTSEKVRSGLRSILCVPIKIQNRPLGTLHINHWHEPRHFSAEEIALLQGVTNQAAIAIENARLFANERHQLRLSQTLQEVGSLLTSSLHLEQVYEQIFRLLDQVISYNSASLFLFDKANHVFAMAMARGLPQSLIDSRDFTLPADLVFEQVPVSPGWTVAVDLRQVTSWINLAETDTARAWIGALLIVKDQINGLLCVDGERVGQYSDEDGRTVATFANQAAIAIENARLHDETVRQAKELAILNQVAQESDVSLDIDEFLENVTYLVAAELYPNSFGFIMHDAETDSLHIHPSYQGLTEAQKQTQIPIDSSIVGEVFRSGQPYYAPNLKQDPNNFSILESDQSEIVVPLKVNARVIGVIDVASSEPDHYSRRDINFLTTLASNIAAVLERARLYEKLRIQTESLSVEVSQRTAELQLERDRLFAILESAGEGILLTDTKARIMYANHAMERQSGYTRDELRLQNPSILGSKQVPKGVFADMWQNLLSKKRWTGELINRHKDGRIYDVAVTVTPISNSEGEMTGYVSVQADITRLKEVERLKTEFIANVSHQLRTPLTNIKTYVSLLDKGRPENYPRYFSVLHFEIDRLARLIQDLLDISRLDAEAEPKPDAAADFCDFWDTFWLPFLERAEREEKALDLHLSEAVRRRCPAVIMESYQLEKIVSRLIENGLMYTPEGGSIRVAAEWQEEMPHILQLKICDSGPGIPEGERPFIFDRFFRGAQVVEAGFPGNGLGLAIVKELLDQRGGEIWLESEVGQGSCFTVHLPLVQTTINGASG